MGKTSTVSCQAVICKFAQLPQSIMYTAIRHGRECPSAAVCQYIIITSYLHHDYILDDLPSRTIEPATRRIIPIVVSLLIPCMSSYIVHALCVLVHMLIYMC